MGNEGSPLGLILVALFALLAMLGMGRLVRSTAGALAGLVVALAALAVLASGSGLAGALLSFPLAGIALVAVVILGLANIRLTRRGVMFRSESGAESHATEWQLGGGAEEEPLPLPDPERNALYRRLGGGR